MPSHYKQLELDARWLYWRSFLFFFLLSQLVVWQRVRRLPARLQGHRMLVFLLAPWATFRSIVTAIIAGGFLTLVAVVLVHFMVRPLLKRWLSPSVDPAGGQFHLGARERVVASQSARRQAGWTWQPGSLTLTESRLWFFPSAWEVEPWSLRVDEVDQVKPQRSFVAELGPLRNWPRAIELRGKSGQEALFAMSDPEPLLDWYCQLKRADRQSDVSTGCQTSGEIDG